MKKQTCLDNPDGALAKKVAGIPYCIIIRFLLFTGGGRGNALAECSVVGIVLDGNAHLSNCYAQQSGTREGGLHRSRSESVFKRIHLK